MQIQIIFKLISIFKFRSICCSYLLLTHWLRRFVAWIGCSYFVCSDSLLRFIFQICCSDLLFRFIVDIGCSDCLLTNVAQCLDLLLRFVALRLVAQVCCSPVQLCAHPQVILCCAASRAYRRGRERERERDRERFSSYSNSYPCSNSDPDSNSYPYSDSEP